ncbi:hypothetical protein [Mycobacterium sp. Marseille-P9652]|uniref:hypothetical protein n=1 Tax=Mycobacterium sp. Marseille-P9652 TaxID=2654950 RepID=UPI0018CFFD9C|nr:hypothetical protein [Mycobacterium sp. Marseille-P9652]
MNNHNIVWIVIAVVVAVLVIAAVVAAAARARRQRRLREAEEIREQARVEAGRVERRQAVADETAARARAAQAEAEAKAAEAARLQERAAMHHNEAASSRERLQEQWERADSIDPTNAQKQEQDPAVRRPDEAPRESVDDRGGNLGNGRPEHVQEPGHRATPN